MNDIKWVALRMCSVCAGAPGGRCTTPGCEFYMGQAPSQSFTQFGFLPLTEQERYAIEAGRWFAAQGRH